MKGNILTIGGVCQLSSEVQTGELLTTVFLDNAYTDPESREADRAFVLRVTYPTAPVRTLVHQITEKLSGKTPKGGIVVRGSYGAGKSHVLLVLYHLFQSQAEERQKWLREWDIPISGQASDTGCVAAVQLVGEKPDTLWEKLFAQMGREDLNGQVGDYPTRKQWAMLGQEKPTVLILDELEGWYEALDAEDKKRQRNALQNLLEAAELPIPLTVVLAVYGTNDELMGIVNRTQPPVLDVGTAEDRWKIVRHRLIDRLDEAKAHQVVNRYRAAYEKIPDALPSANLSTLVEEMMHTYPFHPRFLHKAFEVYAAMPKHELTRGVIGVCATLLRRWANARDLILMGDLDPTEEEIASDLRKLDPELVQNALEDLRERCREVEGATGFLATVLLHSFMGLRAVGATEEDLWISNLRPEGNINDLREEFRLLYESALFLDKEDERYVITKEVNLEKQVEQLARAKVEKPDGREEAAERIRQVLREAIGGDVLLYPDEPITGEGGMRLQIIVGLEPIREHFEEVSSLLPDNTVLLLAPKAAVGERVTHDREWLLQAARMLICEELLGQKGKRQSDVRRLKERHAWQLQQLVSQSYARWLRLGRTNELGESPRFVVRGVECKLSRDAVYAKLVEIYDESAFRDGFAKLLRYQGTQAPKGSEQAGLTIRQIRDGLRRERGLPVLGEPTSAIFEQALRSMVMDQSDSGVVAQVRKALYGYGEEALPEPLSDDWRVWLKSYAPEPPAKTEVKEQVRQECARARSEGVVVSELRRRVVERTGASADEVRRAIMELVNDREAVLERDDERCPDDGHLPIDKVRDDATVWFMEEAPPDDRRARGRILELVRQAGEAGIAWGQVKAHLQAEEMGDSAVQRAIDRLFQRSAVKAYEADQQMALHDPRVLTDTHLLRLPKSYEGGEGGREERHSFSTTIQPYRLPASADLLIEEFRNRLTEEVHITEVAFTVHPASGEADPLFGADEQVRKIAKLEAQHRLTWYFDPSVSKEVLLNLVVRQVERLKDEGEIILDAAVRGEVSA